MHRGGHRPITPLRGVIGRWPPKDFLAPKLCHKWRLTGYYCYLILKKITKFVASRCQILRLKCTKFNFSWGSAPDPTGGAYSALLLLREDRGRGREGGGGRRTGEGNHEQYRLHNSWGGNTDVCPGRQTPSRCHCSHSRRRVALVLGQYQGQDLHKMSSKILETKACSPASRTTRLQGQIKAQAN